MFTRSARLRLISRLEQFSLSIQPTRARLRKTNNRFVHVKTRFANPGDQDLQVFRSLLQSQDVVNDSTELAKHNCDWMRRYTAQSKLILKPRTSSQVSGILRHCNHANIAIVPQGGNTGLVGGSVPVADEVIVNLCNMNRILSFDEVSGVLVCEAGAILENVDNWLSQHDYMFPLDLGAKGSCQIGGNIATAAGGIRYLRYGSLHGNVLGLEVILADGTVLDNLQTLSKDNTGYDLKQLFIGSEGTLGVITKAAIKCARRPKSVNVALIGLESYQSVLAAYSMCRERLQEILSAFEVMDAGSMRLSSRHTGKQLPMQREFEFYCLIETQGSQRNHDEEKLTGLLEEIMEKLKADGTVAQDKTQMRELWEFREGITEALSKEAAVLKYDTSLPLNHFYDIVQATKLRLLEADLLDSKTLNKPVVDVVGFGHLGDGNIHLNIALRQKNPIILRILEPWIYEWIKTHKGSISAEHGLGQMKRNYLKYSKSIEMIKYMHQIKQLFDPNGILCPGKYLPDL